MEWQWSDLTEDKAPGVAHGVKNVTVTDRNSHSDESVSHVGHCSWGRFVFASSKNYSAIFKPV